MTPTSYTIQFLALIGFAYAFPKLQIRRDISYGIYLYHMIIINVMLELGFTDGNILYYMIVMASSLILAYFSSYIPDAFKRVLTSKSKA